MAEEQTEVTRLHLLKAAFGDPKGEELEGWMEKMMKVNYEAYVHKLSLLTPLYASLSTLTTQIPKYWLNSLTNCSSTAPLIDPVDRECLAYLHDVKVVHKSDERDFDVEFHFSSKNPFFTNPVLTLSYTVTPPSSSPASPPPRYYLEADLYSLPPQTPIHWTSPDHNLTLKAPRDAGVGEKEEFDESGLGSFFNFWNEVREGEEGEEGGVGEVWLDWWGRSLEYAANLPQLDDLDSDDEEHDHENCDSHEEDSDEEEDLTKEIDLESEDEGRKRGGKRVRKH